MWRTYEGSRPIQVLVCTLDHVPYLPVLLSKAFLHDPEQEVPYNRLVEDGARKQGKVQQLEGHTDQMWFAVKYEID